MKTFVVALVLLFVVYAEGERVATFRLINTLDSFSGRIVRGEDAERHQFPYQAAILWSSSGSPFQFRCSGSLISKRWVVTTANCEASGSGEYQIKLGQLLQNETHEDIQIFKVKQFIPHPEFPGGVAANNIALIELDREAVLSDAVQIVRLANEEECNAIENSIISGWGKISSVSKPAVHLQWVTVPRITNEACAELLRKFIGTSDPLDDTMICIESNPGQYQGICAGDIGDPLVLENGNALTGIASWYLSPCGSDGPPSGFTRICSHMDFINEHVKE